MKKIQGLMLACSLAFAGAAIAASPADAQKGLHAACPALKTHSADLTFESPVKGAASLDAQRDRKWKEAYTFKVKVSNTPSPKVFGEYKAQGQSCSFEVEAAHAETISVAKSPCQAICKGRSFSAGAVAYFGADGSEEFKR